MGIKNCGTNKWRVIARVRKGNKIPQKQEIVFGTKLDAEKKLAELKQLIRTGTPPSPQCSLTSKEESAFSTFEDFANFYVERNGYGGLKTQIETLIQDLGNVLIRDFEAKFSGYITLKEAEPSKRTGRLLKNSTINRYVQTAKAILGFAAKKKRQLVTGLKQNPLAGYELEDETPRDRVLDEDERGRLLDVLRELSSYLFWPVYFSLLNPIRRGDLSGLTRKNLDLSKPWIHFYPKKTVKRKNRETILLFLDQALLDYFQSLPSDCEYLFPMSDRQGKYKKLGDFKKHWKIVLEKAKIENFVWHDLKHCAMTKLLDEGLPELFLKTLGIQYDPRMIERYYHHDAKKALKWWQRYSGQEINQEIVVLRARMAKTLSEAGYSENEIEQAGLGEVKKQTILPFTPRCEGFVIPRTAVTV